MSFAASATKSRGAVFTRQEVVDCILDLAGYTEDRPLYNLKLLEPSFGAGAFLLPVVDRLMKAWRNQQKSEAALEDLGNAIRAVELHQKTFNSTHAALVALLQRNGLSARTSIVLAERWLSQEDFLLAQLDGRFDFVVGNPPYVRQEMIPRHLLAAYRRRYRTMYGRADLYVPFIQRSLSVLSKGGTFGFICADRWMKNRYGGPLRKLIAEQFNLKVCFHVAGSEAFDSVVDAYPAITIISRETQGPTRVLKSQTIKRAALRTLVEQFRAKQPPNPCGAMHESTIVTNSAEPWILESSDKLALIHRLERQFPSLEEAGCKVGIGVATGADKAFIGAFDALDVEPDCKLPLVTTADIRGGMVKWAGLGVINPFANSGALVELRNYPRLRRYLEERREVIAGRYCAKKAPAAWYRTIDKINPALAKKPKLLIPDLAGERRIVFEDGKFYPHHNLYYVLSATWPLRALQAVMLSAVTHLFVAAYSTKMRGGCFRYQAQYLRRIRLPDWRSVPKPLQAELVDAATKQDRLACDSTVSKIYGLSSKELKAVWNE